VGGRTLGPPPHESTTTITTVWKACGADVYASPEDTAAAYYGILLILAVLVLAYWFWARKKLT
jgi:hypothetical protein